MPKTFDEIDLRVVDCAKKLFFSLGLEKTEMKVIAENAGISRRTIYRRFQSKENIAFYVAMDILKELYAAEEEVQGETGFERFRFLERRELERMKNNPEKVRFLDEFDQKFSDDYPGGIASEDYVIFNAQRYDGYKLKCRVIEEGIRDGSIRPVENVDFLVRSYEQYILGICQRILPREQHILREQGYGAVFVDRLFDILMDAVERR